jgi:diguanylate cyclase (GGDEF)-like protein
VQSFATPPAAKGPGEQSVDDLSREVQQYDQQVAQADEGLRACVENPQAAEIEAILGSLRGSTQQYLESRNRLHAGFSQFCQGQAETGEIGEGLQAAIGRQDAQIQRTSAMIEGFDYRADLKEGCQQMLNQTGKLIDSNDQLRETLDETRVKLAGDRLPIQKANAAPQKDLPGELSGPTGLEAELHKWWNRQPDGAPNLSVAMIELDDSVRLEQQHGGEVIDQVLRAVGEMLQAAGGGEGHLLSLSRPQFCLVFPEADTRLAANTAERLRQTVQQTSLRHAETEIPVTVSCAVVGAAAEDTPGTLAERADATLREARRYGCNRTFLHDGKYPTPVVPPVFSLAQQHVTL